MNHGAAWPARHPRAAIGVAFAPVLLAAAALLAGLFVLAGWAVSTGVLTCLVGPLVCLLPMVVPVRATAARQSTESEPMPEENAARA